MKKNRFTMKMLTMMLAVAVVLSFSTPERADALSIRLDDLSVGGVGVHEVQTNDNNAAGGVVGGLSDLNSATGSMTLAGSFGTASFTTDVGTSTASPEFISLDYSLTGVANGNYDVSVSDLFGPAGPPTPSITMGASSSSSFAAGAVVTVFTYSGDELFTTDHLLSTHVLTGTFQGFTTSIPFTAALGANAPHYLNIVANYNFDAADGTITGGTASASVPEPSILLLMGAGLVGLGLSGKFRSHKV